MKILILAIVAILSSTVFAATDTQVAQWADEVLAAKAKTVIVKPGEAKIVSVYQSMLNGGERKVVGKIYWDVDCYSSDGVKHVCTAYLSTSGLIGESGFGRFSMKSCYVGNITQVCNLVKAESRRRGNSGDHGSWDDVQCSTTGKVVEISYTTTNDYDGSAKSDLKIDSCL